MAFVPNNYTNDNRITIYSDGPETINKAEFQTLLRYMNNSKTEICMPINKIINLGMYHNNDSGSPLTFGFIVKNEESNPKAEPAHITINKYKTGLAPSIDKTSTYDKLNMSAPLEQNFLNGKTPEPRTDTIKPGEVQFILALDEVPDKNLIIERAEIYCDSDKCKIRAICCPVNSPIKSLWPTDEKDIKETEYPCSTGQFSGVVDYSQKNLIINTNNQNPFTIMDVDNKYNDINNRTSEYTTVYFAKENGKKYFAGNYSIIYNITLQNSANKILIIRPHWHSYNSAARVVLKNPRIQSTWYTTSLLQNNGLWQTLLGKSSTNTIQFLLPGANCGKFDFEVMNFKSSNRKYGDTLLNDIDKAVYSKAAANLLNLSSLSSLPTFQIIFDSNPNGGEDTRVPLEMINTSINYVLNYLKMDFPELFWLDKLVVDYNTVEVGNLKIGERAEDKIAKATIIPYKNSGLSYSGFISSLNAAINTINSEKSNYTGKNLFVIIHDWLTDNITYTSSSSTSYDSVYGAFVVKKANSKGFSAALTLLCRKFNINCISVNGKKNGQTHSWNYVYLDNDWRFVDSSLNIPSDTDYYKYRYFLREMPSSYVADTTLPTPVPSNRRLIKFGDVNGDNSITSKDSSLTSEYVLNSATNITPIGKIAACVSGESNITFNDVSLILQYINNAIITFPVENKLKNYN